MDTEFVIFSNGKKCVLMAENCGTLTTVCFQDETEFTSLVPAMDCSVGTTCITNTILIEAKAVEFGLSVGWTESTIFEKLLGGISWVPVLKGSGCDGGES